MGRFISKKDQENLRKRFRELIYIPKRTKAEIRDNTIMGIYLFAFVVGGVIIYTPYFVFIELPEISLVLLKRGFEYVKEKFIYYTYC